MSPAFGEDGTERENEQSLGKVYEELFCSGQLVGASEVVVVLVETEDSDQPLEM